MPELHRIRSELLGAAALVEDRIDLVLAMAHGRDADHVWALYTNVYPRLQLPPRVEMLKAVLEQTTMPRRPPHKTPLTWAQARPLIMPLIEELIRTRNTVAHSLIVDSSDSELVLQQRRHGRVTRVTLGAGRTEALIKQAGAVVATLEDALPHVNDLTVWGTLYGFDDDNAT